MAGSWGEHLQDNLNIDNQIIQNIAHLLYSNGNRSCFGHPSQKKIGVRKLVNCPNFLRKS